MSSPLFVSNLYYLLGLFHSKNKKIKLICKKQLHNTEPNVILQCKLLWCIQASSRWVMSAKGREIGDDGDIIKDMGAD